MFSIKLSKFCSFPTKNQEFCPRAHQKCPSQMDALSAKYLPLHFILLLWQVIYFKPLNHGLWIVWFNSLSSILKMKFILKIVITKTVPNLREDLLHILNIFTESFRQTYCNFQRLNFRQRATEDCSSKRYDLNSRFLAGGSTVFVS